MRKSGFGPILSILLITSATASCGRLLKPKNVTMALAIKQPLSGEADLATLRAAVSKIFDAHCASCHDNGATQGGFGYVKDLDRMIQSEARFIVAGKPEESKIYQRMTATNPNLSMPVKGLLPQDMQETVRIWIVAEGQKKDGPRDLLALPALFKTIREDFDRQQDRINVRYLHFAGLWNAGISEDDIQVAREALSKTLNMLSTKRDIIKPTAVDGRGLIFRIHLQDYNLHMPQGLDSPTQASTRIGRWKEVFEYRRPARDNAVEDAYFFANFTVRPPEYPADTKTTCVKGDARIYHCDPNIAWMRSVMTLNNPTLIDGDPVLTEYATHIGKPREQRTVGVTVREINDEVVMPNVDATDDTANGFIRLQKPAKPPLAATFVEKKIKESPVLKLKPTTPFDRQTNNLVYAHEHSPVPVVRGDWFIDQVAANYKQRVYYNLAGIPQDTGVLDITLGIDDEGALVRDNGADGTGKSLAPIIKRAGFTNSGVSQNHRILERIETQQYTNKALWRSYEFDPVGNAPGQQYNNVLDYPFGPVLFPQEPGVLGYECINMFSDPNVLFKNAGDLSPLTDWASRYWTQTPINFEQFRPGVIGSKAEYLLLSDADKVTYQGYWGPQSTKPEDPMINKESTPPGYNSKDIRNCNGTLNGRDVREEQKLFNFHGFEYQFMRPNGLQGFATVGTNAFISDSKIPNQIALANSNAVFARDEETGAQIVIQPLSCLSCHSRGLIPKDDKIREYINANTGNGKRFTEAQRDKGNRIYLEKDTFRKQIETDNKIITDAITATGARVAEIDPIVLSYKTYEARASIEVVAGNLGLTPADLIKVLDEAAKSKVSEELSLARDMTALRTSGGEVQRGVLETHLPRLIDIAARLKLITFE